MTSPPAGALGLAKERPPRGYGPSSGSTKKRFRNNVYGRVIGEVVPDVRFAVVVSVVELRRVRDLPCAARVVVVVPAGAVPDVCPAPLPAWAHTADTVEMAQTAIVASRIVICLP